MSDTATGLDILAPILLSVLTGLLFLVFTQKRRSTSIHALDWMMAIFGATSLMGIFQVLYLFFHDQWSIFVPTDLPRGFDIVKVIHLIILLILFIFGEHFLSDKLNSYRLIVVATLTTLFFTPAILYFSTNKTIFTNEILPFAQNTLFDEFIFDILQVFIVSLIFYVFVEQFRMTDNKTIRRYLLILDAAILLFLLTAILEVFEHLFPIEEVNAFMSALPTFLILSYFYIKNPNFVYLAPANIAFLQIVDGSGQLLYAAELTDELNTSDFLVGPSLTSINSIISELVTEGDRNIELKQFVYTGGHILFENIGSVKAILQTDRPSKILKRSMRYFLREFHKEFSSQIDSYKGYIGKNTNGTSPDDVFRQCIPIVQSKAITSTIETS